MQSYIAVYQFLFFVLQQLQSGVISGQGVAQLAWPHQLLICLASKGGARHSAQLVIVSSVDNCLGRVYYKSNATILELYISRISCANVTGYATCVSLSFVRGLLITNSTYSNQIHEFASTKMILLCDCHKYCLKTELFGA